MLTLMFAIAIVLMVIIGFYSLLVSRNLVRVLISLEILTKATTLLLIVGGRLTNQMGMAQAFAITLIVIEVVLMAVAAGIIYNIYRHNGSLDTRHLRNLKG
jgi:multisubunit Na+/H+ antiporter MnhC subunit